MFFTNNRCGNESFLPQNRKKNRWFSSFQLLGKIKFLFSVSSFSESFSESFWESFWESFLSLRKFLKNNFLSLRKFLKNNFLSLRTRWFLQIIAAFIWCWSFFFLKTGRKIAVDQMISSSFQLLGKIKFLFSVSSFSESFSESFWESFSESFRESFWESFWKIIFYRWESFWKIIFYRCCRYVEQMILTK